MNFVAGREYVHWFSFDTFQNTDVYEIKRFLDEGYVKDYRLSGAVGFDKCYLRIKTAIPLNDLDLNYNTGSTSIRLLDRAPNMQVPFKEGLNYNQILGFDEF